MRTLRLGLIVLIAAGFAVPLHAQSAGTGYLFGAPDLRFSLRAGYAHANAKSDLFDFVIDNLTLQRSSFSGPSMGADLSVRVAPRLDLTFSADYSAAVRTSEDRRYSEGANNLPIEQTTSFRRVPLSANAVVYLTSRGRTVGRLAWIPNRIVPWIGAGGGTMWYRFQQEGDFVDYQTLNIFPAKVESSGWAPMVQGLGGVDVTLTPRFAVTLDGRYMWAKGNLSSDFRSFEEKVDLSGITGSIGFTIRM